MRESAHVVSLLHNPCSCMAPSAFCALVHIARRAAMNAHGDAAVQWHDAESVAHVCVELDGDAIAWAASGRHGAHCVCS